MNFSKYEKRLDLGLNSHYAEFNMVDEGWVLLINRNIFFCQVGINYVLDN